MSAPHTNRPLSPHLQIYRWQLTMITSILHRITGAGLCVGMLMISWWLVAAMLGPDQYALAMNFTRSPIGILFMFGWTVALYYHLFNGIRHLIWDRVHLFKIQNAYRAGYLVLLLTALATAATWYDVYS